MYEDNLYLSTLYEYLDTPVPEAAGELLKGPHPEDGIRFENVSFVYPGATEPALADVSLHLPPGGSLALVGENGSGKTTLIKLLTRLYRPTSGRVLLDGLDLALWEESRLRERIGVIFQDFARYQMLVGENVGAGDEPFFLDEARWRRPPPRGRRRISSRPCPAGTTPSLASGSRMGANCRVDNGRRSRCRAPSCAFAPMCWCWMSRPRPWMRARRPWCSSASGSLGHDRMTILISHRFSTVRMADQIAVLEHGRIIERGSHEELMRLRRALRGVVFAAGARLSLNLRAE